MAGAMTKKGMAINELGIIILVIFFLAIIFFGGFVLYGEEISNVGNLLPSFLGGNEIKGGVEILRYHIIPPNKVQYYDGVRWKDFENGEVVLNGKKIFENDAANGFSWWHTGVDGAYSDIPRGRFYLRYFVKDNNERYAQKEEKYFCVKMYEGRYLVADLSKEASEGEVCK